MAQLGGRPMRPSEGRGGKALYPFEEKKQLDCLYLIFRPISVTSFKLNYYCSCDKPNKMQKIVLTILLLFSINVCFTQNAIDSGSFFLHKFAQNIGREKFMISKIGNELTYQIDFKFTDRGSPVPLKAMLVTTTEHEPLKLFIKGNTSRFSEINDSIRIQNKTAVSWVDSVVSKNTITSLSFPVAGYSPGTVQMVLLKYWQKHGQPESIAMLPKGEVKIKNDGKETLRFQNADLVLNRYIISGLIWGNEIAWTDNSGNLICLITNDAEGDKLEMMREAYEPLLPQFISKAATYAMKLFNGSMKMDSKKNKTLAIVGGNVIDVEGKENISNAVILIQNGIISKLGNTSNTKIPANATVIHAEGKTILPGLWDMHAHFQQAEWGPAYLAAGVTTVRDCGNEYDYINAIKEAVDSHKGIGPLILKAGIIDGSGPMALGIVRADTKEEAVKVVNMYKNNGFAQIKLYSSVKPDIVKAICDEAHRLNLSVTGHIPQNMSTQAGVDSGMDMINHMQYIFSMMKRNKDRSVNLDDSTSKAALAFLKAHRTVVDPTIGVFEMTFRSVDEDIKIMEPNYFNLPLPLQQLFTTMGMPAETAKKNRPVYESMKNLVKALYDNGITIVAGTDMGFPGYSLPRELELYVEAGLTPLQAIQTATITPAQVMKMEKTTGSIKAGKKADLIILDANPLTEIRNIRKVHTVIKEGQEYDPHVLHKMVGFGN